MKIKDLLNRKVDLKTFLLTGPLGAIYNMFSRKIIKKSKNTNIVYDVRQSQPIVIRSEKYLSNYFNHSNLKDGIGIDSVKFGMKREICDEIMKSDFFEWNIEETTIGTKVSARIIINKF